MKKVAILMFLLIYLNAQTDYIDNNKSLKQTLRKIEALDKIPNILSLKYEDKFFYLNNKKVFASAKEFIEENFNLNKKSPKYEIYNFYKLFLKQHINDLNKTLFNYINLKRINFAYKYFVGENRDKYYLNALNSIKDNTKKAYIYLTKFYFTKKKYKKALEFANLAPKNREIQNIIDKIKSKNLSIEIEKVNLPNENILARVNFKNIDTIFLKVYKEVDTNISNLANKKPLKEFKINLPKIEYRNSSTEISFGKYELGEYTFIISDSNKFLKNGSIIGSFKVSNIGIIKLDRKILVLNRDSGNPIEKAKVIIYEDIDRENLITSLISGKNGVVEVPKSIKKYFINIEYQNKITKISDPIYTHKEELLQKAQNNLFIIKDKDIYTLGDKIQFQGLTIKSFLDKKPKIIPEKKIELKLYDGDRLIQSKIFESDDFGAFDGYFQIPQEIKEDNLILVSEDNLKEKIKVIKPQIKNFQIKINDVEIDKKSKISGEVLSNNNRKIELKSVKYYLQRGDNLVEVDNIDITKDGKFEITINTELKDIYKLYILAINIEGEKEVIEEEINRKTGNIKVNLVINRYIDKNSPKYLRVEAKNLDGEDINISGEIIIKKINPIKLSKYRYWKEIEKELFNKIEFNKKFFQYSKKEDIQTVKTIKYNSLKSDKIELKIEDSGIYKILLYIKDKNGEEIKISKNIIIFDSKDKVSPFKTEIWHMLDRDRYNIGSTALLTIKSSIPDKFTIFELEKNGKIIKEGFLRVNQKTTIEIPIKEEYRGGLNYSITTIKDNRIYIKKGKIDIPWDNKLDIEYLSFSKILKPQIEEKWKFKTKDKIQTKMFALISNSNINLDINRLYKQNKQNFANLWRAFEFEAKKVQIKRNDNIKIEPISENILVQLKSDITQDIKDETLLFKPRVESNRDGELDLNFKTPNRVGKWNFYAFIHSKDLRFHIIDKEIEIKKDFVLNSKLPNFLRVGDNISISTKIINNSDKDLNLTVKLELIDIKKHNILSKDILENITLEEKEIKNIEHNLKIPNINLEEVELKISAEDKNNRYIDILKKRIPIIKSSIINSKSTLFQIEPKNDKFIIFNPIRDINISVNEYKTLILEFTSNLSWEAIMAIEPLIKKDAYSNIDIFNQYFVSAITLNLLKTYKSIDEIDIFNLKEISKVKKEALNKILNNIGYDGGWNWFKSRSSNFYITLYILDGIRKLKEMGIKPKIDDKIIDKAIEYIDNIVISRYKSIKKYNKNNLSEDIIYYLYIRNFYNQPLISKKIYNYYIELIKNSWKSKSIYQQALIALTLNKKLEKGISKEILENIEKHMLIDENLGLYLDTKEKRILTQIAVIELIYELEKNSKSLELMQIWLIEQKDSKGWKSSLLTSNSIYTLLSHSKWLLDNILPIDISFKSKIEYQNEIEKAIKNIKNGIGYYKIEFDKFDRNFSTIQINNNPNDKAIWGHIHFEYSSKKYDNKNLPIKIEKYIESLPLKEGKLVEIKLKLKLDKDLKFLILEDELPIPFKAIGKSGFIVNQNIKYYKTITKSGVSLHFPKISKGEYIFKYKVQITHKGKFKGGATFIKSIFNQKLFGYLEPKEIIIN